MIAIASELLSAFANFINVIISDCEAIASWVFMDMNPFIISLRILEWGPKQTCTVKPGMHRHVCPNKPKDWWRSPLGRDRWILWEKQWLDKLMDCPQGWDFQVREAQRLPLNFSSSHHSWKINPLLGDQETVILSRKEDVSGACGF